MSPRLASLCAVLCLSAAHGQTGYLTYPTDAGPKGVAAADINGDGKPDLVVVNSGSSSLTALINDGAGGFRLQSPFTFDSALNFVPQAILTADLNRDSRTDLIVTGATTVPVQNGARAGPAILLGNGDGTFQPPQFVAGCPQPTSLVTGDWNLDGISDLAVTCLRGGFLVPVGADLLVLPGNGDGTFATGVSFSLGFTPWAVVTPADFNHDGAPDLAVASGFNLTVLLNDGQGGFKTATTSRQPWNFAPGIIAADFNGDGVPDLAVSSQSPAGGAPGVINILTGKGDGTFTPRSSLQTSGFGLLAAQDLNGDNRIDLVEGLSGIVFFAGRGDGTFAGGQVYKGSGTTGYFALADFSGDGHPAFAGTVDLQTAGSVLILEHAGFPALTLANPSSAGFELGPLAPGSLVTAFGSGLSTQSGAANLPLPTSLAGASVDITDAAGVTRHAPLYFVSPGQVNYIVPENSASGTATVSIAANHAVTASGKIQVLPVAPTLFTVNAQNLMAANVLRVSQNGDRVYESLYQTDTSGNITASPIDPGSATDTVYLMLYGTGFRNGSAAAISVDTGTAPPATVTYAGPQGIFEGVDQLNVQLPQGLASPTPFTITLRLTVAGQPSNPVTFSVQ